MVGGCLEGSHHEATFPVEFCARGQFQWFPVGLLNLRRKLPIRQTIDRKCWHYLFCFMT